VIDESDRPAGINLRDVIGHGLEDLLMRRVRRRDLQRGLRADGGPAVRRAVVDDLELHVEQVSALHEKLGPARYIERAVERLDVVVHGVATEAKLLADSFLGLASEKQPKNFALSLGQSRPFGLCIVHHGVTRNPLENDGLHPGIANRRRASV
jgi:hypothetical protein